MNITLPAVILDFCVVQKEQGKTWQNIADSLKRLGFKKQTGKPYYCAELAFATLRTPAGAKLRKRTYRSLPPPQKVVTTQGELQLQQPATKRKGRPVGALSWTTRAKKMKELGLSAEQILAAMLVSNVVR